MNNDAIERKLAEIDERKKKAIVANAERKVGEISEEFYEYAEKMFVAWTLMERTYQEAQLDRMPSDAKRRIEQANKLFISKIADILK